MTLRTSGKSSLDAAMEAGYTRLRPVCMTALAMIIGMLPMALALGSGGEQNAPIGRAVIGGLLFASVGTLFIVPVTYSLIRKEAPVDYAQRLEHEIHPQQTDPEAAGCVDMIENSTQQTSPTTATGTPIAPHRSRVWIYILIALVVMIALLFFGWMPRHKVSEQINAQANQETNALPVVEVMTVHQAASAEQLTLPGTVTPNNAAHIYSRAAGYLKARYVDLGDKVRKGQLLAVISAPDLDAAVLQQRSLLQQSKDALNKARSQATLEQVTYDRIHTLVLHGILSQQDDTVALAALKAAQEDVRVAEGTVSASTATLEGATSLALFEQIPLADRRDCNSP